jgi:plastocyanin
MSMRNTLGLLAAGMIPFLSACGGGNDAPPATSPAAPSGNQAAAPASGGAATTTGTASVSGKISFEGTAPASEKVKLSADPKCSAKHPDGLEKQAIKVKDGKLADVLVYVKSGANGTYTAPTEAVTLDQNGCNYIPHIVALQVGQPLKIRNSDDTLHNIHPRPEKNKEFNFGQPRQGMETEKKFDQPEIKITVGCDVHPWMRSYIHVLANPFFAVTKEDGTFEIKGLPAGEYEIEAVHEKLAPVSSKVTVKDGEKATLDLTVKS